MRRSAAILLLSLLPVAAAAAERDWLPPAAEEVVVKQLAGRLGEIASEPLDDARLLERARQEVGRQRARLESWGQKGILEHVPDLSQLEVPASGDTLLDAMARYHLCAGLLTLTHMNRADPDAAARLATAKGLSALQMAIFSLLHSYLEKGTEAQVEAFLTGKELEVPFNRIQDQPAMREYTARQCRPVVSALID